MGDHGGTIVDLLVDPDRQPGAGGLVRMPERVIAVNPQGASVSSGGETTSAKLQSYIDRLTTKSNVATLHLLATLRSQSTPPPPITFPSYSWSTFRDRMALVAERTE